MYLTALNIFDLPWKNSVAAAASASAAEASAAAAAAVESIVEDLRLALRWICVWVGYHPMTCLTMYGLR